MVEDLTIDKAIDFAIETEKLGLHFYGRLARRFKDDSELHEAFAQLARDEEQHAQRFAKLKEQLPDKQEAMQFGQQEYLRAIALSDVFSKDKGIAKDTDAIDSKQDALERAFNLEKTTLLYYEAMKESLGDKLLDEIINEEKRHVVALMKLMVTDAKVRGLDDAF